MNVDVSSDITIDCLLTGDVLDMMRFPVIDMARGESIQGVIDSLNRIIDLTFAPSHLRASTRRTAR